MFRIVIPVLCLWFLLLGGRAALLANRLDLTVLGLLAVSILYLVTVFLLLRSEYGGREALFVWAAALLLRATAAPWMPGLSDDLYRYRWEGRLQLAGGNPYQVRPADPGWRHLEDETWERVGQKDVKAGYGPLMEAVQAGTARAVQSLPPAQQLIAFKLPYLAAELLVLGMVWRFAGRRRFAWYALSPLPVVEVWWNSHNDAFPVAAMLAALLAARRDRWALAFAALGIGVALKWWPVLLAPAFFVAAPAGARRLSLLTVAAPLLAMAPYWGDVMENARFMSGFIGGWRNNDSLFGLILWLAGSAEEAKRVAVALSGAAALAIAFTRWSLPLKCLSTLTVALLLASNCHPWYLLWIWPLVAVYPAKTYLVWASLVPLAYSVVQQWTILGEWHGSTPERWLIYVPVFLAGVGELFRAGSIRRRIAAGAKTYEERDFSYPG